MKQFYSGVFCILLLSSSAFAQFPVNGLIGYFPFSGNANDRTANANNGTVNGATLTTNRFGQMDSAYQFNGNGNYILLSSSYDVMPRTISIWFNATTIDVNYRNIYNCDNKDLTKGANAFAVQKINNVNKIVYFACGAQDTTTVTANAWHNAVIIVDTGYCSFYLDNVLLHTRSYSTFYHSLDVSTMATVGTSRALNNRFFTGLVDDIRIYDRHLRATELTQLFQETKYLGIKEVSYFGKMSVYPNPASVTCKIDLSAFHAETGLYISICNMVGQELQSCSAHAGINSIDTKEFQKGMYLIQIFNAEHRLLDCKQLLIE